MSMLTVHDVKFPNNLKKIIEKFDKMNKSTKLSFVDFAM